MTGVAIFTWPSLIFFALTVNSAAKADAATLKVSTATTPAVNNFLDKNDVSYLLEMDEALKKFEVKLDDGVTLKPEDIFVTDKDIEVKK